MEDKKDEVSNEQEDDDISLAMEDKKDEVSNDQEADDMSGAEALGGLVGLAVGIFIFVVCCSEVRPGFRFVPILGGILGGCGLGIFSAKIMGFVFAICGGLIEWVFENSKKVMMFMGVVILVLLSVLLVKMIFFG